MAYRDRTTGKKSSAFDYYIMEVRLNENVLAAGARDESRFITVDNHWETMCYVQDNMNEFVANIVRLNVMKAHDKHRDNSATLSQRAVGSLVSTPAGMDKLSASLKKTLLIMVMERYQNDLDEACRVLDITREKLETELYLSGIAR